MEAGRLRYYKGLFLVSAVYDISLGIIFTFFAHHAFTVLGIAEKLPAFGGYLSLIGAFLFVIGVAYALLYLGDLSRNRDLVTVGALYKAAYCSVAFFYFAIGQVPHIAFVGLFGVADLIFLVLMIECRMYLGKNP